MWLSSASTAFAALALAASACDQVYGLHGRADARTTDSDAADASIDTDASDAPVSGCGTEDFDTSYADLAPRWDRYNGSAIAPATVDVTGGRLAFMLPQTVQVNYAGIIRLTPVDLTGASATMEIVDATSHPPGFELFLKLYDEANDDRFYQALLGGSMMHFIQKNQGLTIDQSPFPFDPVSHRFWRIRHVLGSEQIVLETSADNVAFVTRLALPSANVPFTQLRIEIGSGTFVTQVTVLRPAVDNFAFCSPS